MGLWPDAAGLFLCSYTWFIRAAAVLSVSGDFACSELSMRLPVFPVAEECPRLWVTSSCKGGAERSRALEEAVLASALLGESQPLLACPQHQTLFVLGVANWGLRPLVQASAELSPNWPLCKMSQSLHNVE